jgi:hypothetical protein
MFRGNLKLFLLKKQTYNNIEETQNKKINNKLKLKVKRLHR